MYMIKKIIYLIVFLFSTFILIGALTKINQFFEEPKYFVVFFFWAWVFFWAKNKLFTKKIKEENEV